MHWYYGFLHWYYIKIAPLSTNENGEFSHVYYYYQKQLGNKNNFFYLSLVSSSNREENKTTALIKVVRKDWLGNLANHKDDYDASLFHVVCTVTVRIYDHLFQVWYFISLLAVWSFTIQSLLLFVHDQRYISIGKRRTKTYNKESHKFPNQLTVLTLLWWSASSLINFKNTLQVEKVLSISVFSHHACHATC